MKKIKILTQIIYGVVIIFLVALGLALSLTFLDLPINFKLFTVQSGSMEPAIHTGSLILVKPSQDYTSNQIITFKTGDTTTTHRIVEKIIQDDKTQYRTKGDANDGPDSGVVDINSVVGKVIFSIPYLGYPISFARTQTGLIVLIIIPATIIVYGEILNIKKEIIGLINKNKTKPSTSDEDRHT